MDKKSDDGVREETGKNAVDDDRSSTPHSEPRSEDMYSSEASTDEDGKRGSGKPTRKHYSRKILMKLADSQSSRQRPKCLSPEFETPEGYWDPERWFRSFDNSRGSSPLALGARDRPKRPIDLERDLLKRRTSDPRLRIKEEEEDSLGIILSPQRKSFGTGCHVSTANQARHVRPASPNDADRGRGDVRRIGSGRLQIDRERERDVRERDPRDFRERDHENRDFRDSRGRYEEERRSGGYNDRFRGREGDERRGDWRDDRMERREDRDQRGYGRREYGGGSNYGRGYNRRDYRQPEEEPEWFTEGPTSQTDTIELRGFEPVETSSKLSVDEEDNQQKPKTESVGIADRNGSLETNESSSPEAHSPSSPPVPPQPPDNNNPQQQVVSTDFDFNDFFKIEHIPGLAETLASEPAEGLAVGGSSRFSRWFNPAQGQTGSNKNSRSNSRRSSITDEFGLLHDLNDLISGQKSPVIPSPTPPTLLPQHRLFGHLGSPDEAQQQANLLEMIQQARRQHAHVMPGRGSPQNIPIPLGPNGAPPTAREVEADLKSLLLSGNHKGAIDPKSITPLTVPPKGKVTTVAELEASLKDMVMNNNNKMTPAVGSRPVSMREKRVSPPAQVLKSPTDMVAFNKLLGMMKASGALTETPKMPRKNDGRPMSPVALPPLPPRSQEAAFTPQQKSMLQELVKAQQQQQELVKAQQKVEQQQKQQHLQQQFREQQAKLQQQQIQEHLLAVMKQGAAVAKPPPSPLPQMTTLQAPSSPRAPSPNVLVPPTSPRAPSPIMFGSQPPVHLTAPSPIHPSAITPTSQNTLTVQPQGSSGRSPVPRVPSPQELIVHTQAIMQNALLKKQLEDQKERFLRRQHDGKSPNPITQQQYQHQMSMEQIAGVNPFSQQQLIQGQPKTAVSVAFTPTSVMKKMAIEKAEEKERQAKTATPPLGAGLGEQRPPTFRIDHGSEDGSYHGEAAEARALMEHSEADTASQHMSETSSVESITLTVPQFPTMPNFTEPASPDKLAQTSQGGNKLGDRQQPARRPLIGQGTMNMCIPIQVNTVATPTATTQGRPIVKGSDATLPGGVAPAQAPSVTSPGSQRAIIGNQQATVPPGGQIDIGKLMEQQRIQQRLPPPSPNLPRAAGGGIPITGRVGMPPSNVNPAANAMLLQRLMSPNLAQTAAQPRGPVPGVNMTQLNQLAALQAQQRILQDPRLQGVARPIYPNQPGAQVLGGNPRVGVPVSSLGLPNPISRAISPQPQIVPPAVAFTGKDQFSAGLNRSQGIMLGAQGGLKTGSEGPNLARWFSSDVLKQPLPGMPVLPTQSHKVLTVDEIERH